MGWLQTRVPLSLDITHIEAVKILIEFKLNDRRTEVGRIGISSKNFVGCPSLNVDSSTMPTVL